jgi:hypothetical protein
VVNGRKFDDVCIAAQRCADEVFAFAEEHPETVRPYLDDHPILAVEKSRYKSTLV